jgi:hypothetical protein
MLNDFFTNVIVDFTNVNDKINRSKVEIIEKLVQLITPRIITKIVERERLVYKEIVRETTKYIYVNKPEDVKPDKVKVIERYIPLGWREYNSKFDVKEDLQFKKRWRRWKASGKVEWWPYTREDYLVRGWIWPSGKVSVGDFRGENWSC